MEQLLTSLVDLFQALWLVLVALLTVLAPWTPLIAWLAFCLFAIDWIKVWPNIVRGGWIGLVLIGLVATVIWAVIAPPSGGAHYLFGLTVSNFVGKLVYVTSMLVMMLMCGSVQLSGACGTWARFPEASEPQADRPQDFHTVH
jgi:hypothetical protein